ncbi:hypothetical protein [Enhygromyxa salina]|uniref:hypothetical protein n=1 Tax=Enhygromyxa salina TaxID=215803 RepID=UPI000698A9A1|nr:hypothetical protein [Enhygromyxa salina]
MTDLISQYSTAFSSTRTAVARPVNQTESINDFECEENSLPAMMGDYKTEEDPLSAFDGLDGSGTWTFIVASDYGIYNGTVDNWCLILTGAQP